MNARQIFINIIAWGCIGGFLGSAGVLLHESWEFWAIQVCVFIVQINAASD